MGALTSMMPTSGLTGGLATGHPILNLFAASVKQNTRSASDFVHVEADVELGFLSAVAFAPGLWSRKKRASQPIRARFQARFRVGSLAVKMDIVLSDAVEDDLLASAINPQPREIEFESELTEIVPNRVEQ